MESTHAHLFLIPLMYYILIHLFVQTSLSATWKGAIIVLPFINIGGFLVAPYLIRYLSARYALLVPLHEFIFLRDARALVSLPMPEILRNSAYGAEQDGNRKQ